MTKTTRQVALATMIYVACIVVLYFLDVIKAFRFVAVMFVYVHIGAIDTLMIMFANIFSPLMVLIYTIVCAGILFKLKYRKIALILVTSVSLATALTYIEKILFQVGRPNFHQIQSIHVNNFSFPSGHTAILATVLGVMIVYIRIFPLQYRATLKVIFTGVIVLMCFNRLYMGVHWLPDVVGGVITAIYAIFVSQKQVNALTK